MKNLFQCDGCIRRTAEMRLNNFLLTGDSLPVANNLILLFQMNDFPMLWELAEEFRSYSNRGGQVFVSTHSPDFLNACKLEEVFWLEKEGGYTRIKRALDDPQISLYMNDGDQMGYLWKQGFLGEVAPK